MPVTAKSLWDALFFQGSHAAFVKRFFLLFALAASLALQPYSALGAGRYGTPLSFDPPPVDLGQAETAPEPVPDVAPEQPKPARKDTAPESSETRGSAQPADNGKAKSEPSDAKSIRLFGTVEFRSPLKNLPKWERVRNLENEKPSFTEQGIASKNKDVVARWNKLRETLKDAPLMEQAKGVNKFFNQWPYKTDLEVWGVEDYWATPREFLLNSGDCEDYAISKYYALRDLGVPKEKLRVVALKDTIRNIGHAVTVVFIDGDAYILDNLSNLVLSHKKLTHYAPQYSVNEDYLWRHVKPKAILPK